MKWFTLWSRAIRIMGRSAEDPSIQRSDSIYGASVPSDRFRVRETGGKSPGTAEDARAATGTHTSGDVR